MIRNSNAEKLPVPNNVEKVNSSEKTEKTADNPDDDPEPLQDASDIASIDEVINELDAAFRSDKNLRTKLNHQALQNLYKYTGQAKISGYDAEEIVSVVISKMLETNTKKNRKWNKAQCPNIVEFIFMCIVSFIKNERKKLGSNIPPLYDIRETGLESKEKKRNNKAETIPADVVYKNGKVSENTNYDIQRAKNYSENTNTFEQDFEEIILDTERQLEDDLEAYYVFQERLNGVKSNQEIGKKLGITVKDVENALKRIRRKIVSLEKNQIYQKHSKKKLRHI